MALNKEAIKDWLIVEPENPYLLTLKMKNSCPLIASKHLGFFRNRYERAIKKRYKKYLFLPTFEPDIGNPHYHILANRPSYLNHDQYLDVITKTVGQVKQIQRDYNDVTEVYSVKGAFSYMIKKIDDNAEIDYLNLRR